MFFYNNYMTDMINVLGRFFHSAKSQFLEKYGPDAETNLQQMSTKKKKNTINHLSKIHNNQLDLILQHDQF